MRAVDAHVHIFTTGSPGAPRHHPRRPAQLSDVRARAAACGIGCFVLVQPSFLQSDNGQLLDAIQLDPGNLRGIVIVGESWSVEDIGALPAAGVCGIRRPLRSAEHTLKPWEMERLAFAAGLGLHVEMLGSSRDTAPVVEQLVSRGIRVVIPHFGAFDPHRGPDRDPSFQALLDLASGGLLHAKLSAPYWAPHAYCARAAELLIDRLGAGRCVWGSDWPWVSQGGEGDYGERVDWLSNVVGAQMARTIREESPAALYGFGGKTR